MVRQEVNKLAEEIILKANSKREFFLLHGYTGSPTDFNELGKYLNKRFNANVRIIRLRGHGERIEKLDSLHYKDFFSQAQSELEKDLKKGREIIIGGISMGTFLALQLSAKYPVKGVINISIPYKNRFPANIVSCLEPIILKKHWKKNIPSYENRKEKKAFYYDIHIRGFKIIKQAKKELESCLHCIKAPCLIVHIEKDQVFHRKGAEKVNERIKSEINEIVMFSEDKTSHNPFYSPTHKKLYKIIGDFVKKYNLFD